MIETILESLLRHWPAVLFVLLSVWLAANRYNHGLNKYHGPFLASLTDWWRFLDVYGRRPDITHNKLHQKYGDIVRLGPNTLSFADPRAIKTIYGLNKGFRKVAPSFVVAVVCKLLMLFSRVSIPYSKALPRESDCLLSFLPPTRHTMRSCAAPSTAPSPCLLWSNTSQAWTPLPSASSTRQKSFMQPETSPVISLSGCSTMLLTSLARSPTAKATDSSTGTRMSMGWLDTLENCSATLPL